VQKDIADNKKMWINPGIIIFLIVIPAVLVISALYNIQKYYIISAIIIVMCMIPFFASFEKKTHKAGDLVTLATLSAVAVISRVAFAMFPYIKPMLGIIMIAGLVYGPVYGFLVGAITAFVSNFVFMQGVWTPWQMFAYGMAGYIMGCLGRLGSFSVDRRIPVAVAGFFVAAFITGGILDTCSLFTSGLEINRASIIVIYSGGLPFNLIHGGVTALTLFLLYQPLGSRLLRLRKNMELWMENSMGFTIFNPIINFIYFVAAIYFIAVFTHPLYVIAAYIAMILYYLVLNGKKGLRLVLFFFVIQTIYVLLYISHRHFGVTVLYRNSIGNNVTMEAICSGVIRSIKGSSLMLCFLCMINIMSGNRIIYILGRICPKASLFAAILFRNIGRLKERWSLVKIGRHCAGCGAEKGRLQSSVCNYINTASAVIGTTLDDFIECSTGMKSRGYTLKGRTSYPLYRFNVRDRLMLLGMVFLIVGGQVTDCLGYADVLWNPRIIFPEYDTMAWLLAMLYGIYLLIPVMVSIFNAPAS